MIEHAEQRTDVTQSEEDFARIMEDYFRVIPPDLEQFLIEKTTRWKYDDFDNSMTFYFSEAWDLDEFKDTMRYCPAVNNFFSFEEHEHVNREKLTLTIIGKVGGLI